jgi:DNA-binding XRE family transcriptional regulator
VSSEQQDPPVGGWLWTVRKALGLCGAAMAKDLQVSPSTIFQLERPGWNGTIMLERLKAVAATMECGLAYCIVPYRGKFEDQFLE